MAHVNLRFSILIQFLSILLLWILMMKLDCVGVEISWSTAPLIPRAALAYIPLYYIFIRWAWKLPMFKKWLVLIPNLQGTWEGEVQSNWNAILDSGKPIIKIYIVIRQTLFTTSVTMFTSESTSHSESSSMIIDKQNVKKTLVYSYSNVSKAGYRTGSPIHFGTARLNIIFKPDFILDGDYWTSRETTGYMKLKFLKKELLESYPH